MKNYYENFRKLAGDATQSPDKKEIAEILNTSLLTVGDYESGKLPLPTEHLIKLC